MMGHGILSPWLPRARRRLPPEAVAEPGQKDDAAHRDDLKAAQREPQHVERLRKHPVRRNPDDVREPDRECTPPVSVPPARRCADANSGPDKERVDEIRRPTSPITPAYRATRAKVRGGYAPTAP